jgi:alpha-L-arabinofuranosidase
VINVGSAARWTGVKRLGINLGTQNFYDSDQLTQNLTFINPGFEGEAWQSILHCAKVTSTSCTDDNQYAVWPANFFNGAQASFIYGSAYGETAAVTASTAPSAGAGVTISFAALAKAPAAGDYVVVRMMVPGNAQAGWWTTASGGATFATDTTDLSPETPGKQALAILAANAGQKATVNSYFDSTSGRSFLQLQGNYTITFRAKGLGGNNQLTINVSRGTSPSPTQFFSKTITLTNSWQDYSYTFSANEAGAVGTADLSFAVAGASAYLDDVSLAGTPGPNNPTVFRDNVVSTLQSLKPGIIRYMDPANWGSSIDNVLAVPFARVRAGSSAWYSEQDQIPIGLHDFLVLCQTVGAEPWYTLPPSMTTQEMSSLIDYLGGSTSTVYGAKRAALGQSAPWTSVFPTIHLEIGDEAWNGANGGSIMADSTAYGSWTGKLFTAAHATPSFSAASYDLVLNGWAAVPYFTQHALAASSNYNSVDVAPYLFNTFNDASSNEAIFGPMFAQPELYNSTTGGLMQAQATAAASASPPANLNVYESNLSANQGSVSQAAVQAAVPSVGAGIAVIDNMLLSMRDLGVMNQTMFALGGYINKFVNPAISNEVTPLWGTVIDMGNTNLRRPTFLAEQLANSAILPTMLTTTQTGANPTWNQPSSTNDNIALNGAHDIQSFAFSNGTTGNIIVLNLSRTQALPVSFSGPNAPLGQVNVQTLTSSNITDGNENGSVVSTATNTITMTANQAVTLPPFSMTVFSSGAGSISTSPASTITSVTMSCGTTSVSVGGTANCSANVVGTGSYDPSVTWSATAGTISSTGVYTAPATVPSSGGVAITAVSNQNSVKSASTTIAIVGQPTVSSVSVTCTPTTTAVNMTSNCSAKLAGSGSYSSAVTWSASAGTISPSGLYTAPTTVPSSGSATVTATSTQTPTVSGTAVVNLTAAASTGGLGITSVAVSSITSTTATVSWQTGLPAYSGIDYGTSTAYGKTTPGWSVSTAPSFTLTGLQPGTTYYLLLWSVGASGGATVNANASFTTPASGAAAVTSVAVSCTPISVPVSGTANCAATVAGTGTYSSAVTWTTTAGTISSTGVYTAPATAPTSGSAIIIATSTQTPAISGFATLAVAGAATVSSVAVSCSPNSIGVGGTTNCSATVAGTGAYSPAVTWSASAGTISSSGVYTAPATAPAGGSVTITATSIQNTAKTSSATITVTNTAAAAVTSVAVSCTPTSVAVNGTATCTAKAAGTGAYSSAVTWTATMGTISSAGVYTAPATAPAQGSASIIATSTQTPSISGFATIPVNAAPVSGSTLAISSIAVSNVTATGATVSWQTGLPAYSGIDYGPTAGYGTTTPGWSLATTPSFTLTGLQPGTTYYLELWSIGPSGAMVTTTTTLVTPAK